VRISQDKARKNAASPDHSIYLSSPGDNYRRSYVSSGEKSRLPQTIVTAE